MRREKKMNQKKLITKEREKKRLGRKQKKYVNLKTSHKHKLITQIHLLSIRERESSFL